jgi:hypothetical protein
MGGIREKGIILSCDKCENDVEVMDQQAIDFYKAFSSRDDRARLMFMSMTSGIEGHEIGSVNVRYEWLCPECLKTINAALSVSTAKKAAATATGKRRGRPPKSAQAPEAPADQPSPEPAPSVEPDEEKEIDENELFD